MEIDKGDVMSIPFSASVPWLPDRGKNLNWDDYKPAFIELCEIFLKKINKELRKEHTMNAQYTQNKHTVTIRGR